MVDVTTTSQETSKVFSGLNNSNKFIKPKFVFEKYIFKNKVCVA